MNQVLVKMLPLLPRSTVYSVAKRYIAGETLYDAVCVLQQLNSKGVFGTLDVLGEFVRDRNRATESTKLVEQMLAAIYKNQLNSGVSVKLTSLGMDIDEEFCFSNLLKLVELSRQYQRFLRIDMENSPYTTRTLNFYHKLREQGFDNTGVVIQACLRRSEADVLALAPLKPSVRLCKGIYIESENIAFRGRVEVQENYKKLLQLLFENGMHVAIATHDDVLIDFACKYISANSIAKNRYEFQMLLGVCESKRDELVQQGYRVRVYVPFGRDWYGYSVRRLKENPEIAGHVFRAIFKR